MGKIDLKKFMTKEEYEKMIELKQKKKKWKQDRLVKKLEKEKSLINKECESDTEKGPAYDFPTLSIAVPGSILENAQSQELRTYLAGQIARAASIFQVKEVIVYEDKEVSGPRNIAEGDQDYVFEENARPCCLQFARILQYLECPQYLRKYFFPVHKDLKYAGLLNPLDAPHHLRANEDFPFREGVIVSKTNKEEKYSSRADIGLQRPVQLDREVCIGMRVTVELLQQEEGSKKLKGKIVSPFLPGKVTGKYWGYSVRIASSLSAVFAESPYSSAYDLTIGTSDKGKSMEDFKNKELPSFKHALIVFGGLHGIEEALEADTNLKVHDPAVLFDWYLNTCPEQGSRTIRTEEAILITLAALQPCLK